MIDPLQSALDLLTTHTPAFLNAVRRVYGSAPEGRRILTITLDQFENSPLLLYAALYYCGKHGVTVTVKPATEAESAGLQ